MYSQCRLESQLAFVYMVPMDRDMDAEFNCWCSNSLRSE